MGRTVYALDSAGQRLVRERQAGPVAVGDLRGKETIVLDQGHRGGDGFDLDGPVPFSDLQFLAGFRSGGPAKLFAGADMALWSSGGHAAPVLDELERALSDGRLDPAANDLAVNRVLLAKGVCA